MHLNETFASGGSCKANILLFEVQFGQFEVVEVNHEEEVA